MENLKHLIGAYFHQDWNHVYRTREEALADFVRRAPERAETVPGEIDELLESTPGDEALTTRLANMGFDDAPPEGDRAFIVDLQTRLRRLCSAN